MNYFLLSLSYDGGNYHGWVIQKTHPTIQSTLNKALKKVIKSANFKTLGASKTDAGVHAWDQKVILTTNFMPENLNRFCQAINRVLPNDIHINTIKVVGANFNFHEQVVQKTYRYVLNNQQWNWATHRYEWTWTQNELDVQELQTLANLFLGTHDFTNFCGLKTRELNKFNLIRSIESFQVKKNGSQIEFEIQGQGFLRYQIRMMIGAIFKVVQHKKYTTENLKSLLNNPQQGTKIPFIAPAQGLCLKEIILKTVDSI